jgi:hypothetical protein
VGTGDGWPAGDDGGREDGEGAGAVVSGAVVSGPGGLEVCCWSCDGGEISSADGAGGSDGAGGLGAGCGGELGGERHPSSCGICLFFARTAARLLDRVASLTVFARLRGGGAGCGDGAGDGAGDCDSCSGDLRSEEGGEAGSGVAGFGGEGGTFGDGGVSVAGAA